MNAGPAGGWGQVVQAAGRDTLEQRGSQRGQIGQHSPAVLVGQERVVDIPPVLWAAGTADTERAAWANFESCRLPVCLAYSRQTPMQAAAALLDHFHLQNHYLT